MMYDLPQPHMKQPLPAYVLTVGCRPSIGAIIKLPPADKGNENLTYEQLRCTERDRALIYEIITTMADNGKLSLLLKQSHLKQLGAEINHVHPLKFLSTILGNPRLKESLHEIFSDYFKRVGFLDGLGPSLTKEAERGRLNQYAEAFATELNVPLDGVMHYFHCRDWENFVRYLMKQ